MMRVSCIRPKLSAMGWSKAKELVGVATKDNFDELVEFAETNTRDKLVEQFCVEAGGPCEYTGDSMEESHKGLNISRADFNALVEDLIEAMEAEGVAVPVQNRLLARLAPMRGQIIER